MKLRAKLLLLFGFALTVILGLGALGLPRLVAGVTEAQLMALARTVGGYLVHDLSTLPFPGNEADFEKAIDGRFEFVAELGTSTGNFQVNTIILVDANLRVEVGHPDSERGADYSSHADIREAFGRSGLAVVLEARPAAGLPAAVPGPTGAAGAPVPAAPSPGGELVEADIVAPLRLADGDSRVLEIKLDFSATTALLSAQYSRLLAAAGLLLVLSLGLLVAFLLLGVGRTVIRPLLAVSKAMELVGAGRLDVEVESRGRDEIASMGRHFNAMTRGLRERFELERYVSRPTAEAARQRAGAPGGGGEVRRKVLTVFFSDVRGFTSYSERRDPARVIEVLNRLLGAQEELIRAEGGYVDKFVGDETMAVFEEPAPAARAALGIRRRMEELAEEIDGLRLGIGIHLGPLVEGDVGSPRMMDHTLIGDTVNIAARLQAAAGPGQILLSESLLSDEAFREAFELRPLGRLRVKGKEEPLNCFELLGPKAGAAGRT